MSALNATSRRDAKYQERESPGNGVPGLGRLVETVDVAGAGEWMFRLIEDLFLPREPQGVFSIWIAAQLGAGKEPDFKIYVNPEARGRRLRLPGRVARVSTPRPRRAVPAPRSRRARRAGV